MTTRARGLLAAAIAVLVALPAGCGSPPAAGPLLLNQPGKPPAVTNADIDASLGVPADGTVTVFNTAKAPVRITAVSAIPVAGVMTPVLADVGVGTTGRSVAADYGWPVSGVPVVPAVGAELRPGNDNIIFGLVGSKLRGYYAIAGLKIAYSYHGRAYSLAAWSGFTACVIRPGTSNADLVAQCEKTDSVSALVNQYVEKMSRVN
jgi:hypothetical protein